jgi:4-diphosphocytidyl-2-C-methyl-D-erythritol kinase
LIVTSVTVRVPAKINLQLAVGPLRPDGYHDLVTVFHAISLFDQVSVAPAAADGVAVSGEGAGQVPAGNDNLALKAVAALRTAIARRGGGTRGLATRAAPDDPPGVAVTISKRIPVAAGLAGGSADAAAALVACNELWGAGLSQQELCEVAAGVGSDVAFAVLGGTAVGRGRGERLTRALVPPATYHWVLAFADGHLSTSEVYGALDRLRALPAPGRRSPRKGDSLPASGAPAPDHPRRPPYPAAPGDPPRGGTARPPVPSSPSPELSTRLMAALRAGDPRRLGQSLSNDLQAPAISMFPALRKTLAAGREFGALGALVSGSGPTCFFLARGASHATDLAVALSGAGVCRSVARATGPAPGAAVIGPQAP